MKIQFVEKNMGYVICDSIGKPLKQICE